MKRITSFSDCAALEEYAQIVRTGEIRTCKEQKRLLDHLESCFEGEELFLCVPS